MDIFLDTTSALESAAQLLTNATNRYAEIKNVTAPTGTTPFSNGKKIIYENCGEDLPIRASGRIQIVRASELPPPLISSFEIIIV